MNAKLFQSDPRDYALEMVENGLVSADHMLLCALKYMSHDDVRDMLDCNELSPRFDEDEPEEPDYTYSDEDEVRDAFWDQHPQFTPVDFQSQNKYPTDVRCAFVDFVDSLQKNGDISEELAADVTLEMLR